jgi:hypothetical protein
MGARLYGERGKEDGHQGNYSTLLYGGESIMGPGPTKRRGVTYETVLDNHSWDAVK